jgi:predicted glycogen debranching enzyme
MREWIVTNGLGGYTFFNTMQNATRKFHGLLVGSLHPPVERWMFIQNILDRVIIGNKTYHLYDMKPTFSFDLFPTLTYQFNGSVIQKTFCMPHGQNTALIKYDIHTDQPLSLIHEPLVTSRHFYDVYPTVPWIDFDIEQKKDHLLVKPSNVRQKLLIQVPEGVYQKNPYWSPIFYPVDYQRNDSCHDHLFHMGRCIKQIETSSSYFITATIEKTLPKNPDSLFQDELKGKQTLLEEADVPFKYHRLVISSDTFLVKKGEHTTVIAGYPWFSDWGRDTLIALPGLTLVTNRHMLAKDILLELHQTCKHGIIPNTYNDRDAEPAYNTVDASLWFIDRVYQYMRYTDDKELLKTVYPTLQSIVHHYQQGTLHGIHMDGDYLISHDPGLTWMDVKLGDFYPTPRGNKAVEIQALWYNALSIMGLFSQILGEVDTYSDLSKEVKSSFLDVYDEQYDVIGDKDASIRPNKIFLVSLPFNMIDDRLQSDIVQNIQDHLLTVFGLRTLSPKDPNYKGTYFGNYHKDVAYHNGTVWPWLLGSFITAFLKTHRYEKQWRDHAYKEFIEPLLHIYGDKWDGSIHEIFDADPPYAPRGCVAQAWSVSEILRALIEDIEQKRPPYEKRYELDEIRV